MDAETLQMRRERWEEFYATQSATLIVPTRTVPNAWGHGEQVAPPTRITTPCRVVSLSAPREVEQADQSVALCDFEVRLPWRIEEQAVVMSAASIEVEIGGAIQTYSVMGLDRGRPNATYLGCWCIRKEQLA